CGKASDDKHKTARGSCCIALSRSAQVLAAAAQKRLKRRGFYAFGARLMSRPFMLLCVEPWGHLEPVGIRILTIFLPRTFCATRVRSCRRGRIPRTCRHVG